MKSACSTILTIALICSLLTSCTSPSTTGLASARQQTSTIQVTIKGAAQGLAVPIVKIETGPMIYDGTRGDIAKNKAGGDLKDDDTVSIPLPQASKADVAASMLSKLYGMAAGDKAETVPAAFSGMSLADWKLLKASYLECPECLALTPAEEAALKAATGK